MTDFYINKVVAMMNKEENRNDPAIVVWDEGNTLEVREVFLYGPAKIISDPKKPHPSGATIWVTTQGKFSVI